MANGRSIVEVAWRGAAALVLACSCAMPVAAQETPDQYNKANAESRRHSEAQQQLRNQAHDLRKSEGTALQTCQGAGSSAAQSACENQVGIQTQQQRYRLDNQAIGERNNHTRILKGIGVHRVP
jgi:methylthioribose-1-phosphate isomerase